MLISTVTMLLGLLHDVSRVPGAIRAALDDEALLCSCADGWACVDCSLLDD